MEKYGKGEVWVESCNCGYEQTLCSEGVHHDTTTGTIRVYDSDDIFSCPICETAAGINKKAMNCFQN